MPTSDLVERVAMALCQQAIEPRQCPCIESGKFQCRGQRPEHAALAALKAHEEWLEENGLTCPRALARVEDG